MTRFWRIAVLAVFAAGTFGGVFMACKKKKDNPSSTTAGSDATAPTVSNTSAVCGTSVSGSVALSGAAADDTGVSKVEFLVDGAVAGADTEAPYSVSWNTAGSKSGGRKVEVKAYDAAGNTAVSTATCTVTLKKRVFVKTPFEPGGNLGGLSGADAICQNAAIAAGMAGTFKAWLSDSATDAKDRIADVGAWYLPDQTTEVVADLATLTGTGILTAIRKDQNNVDVGGSYPVWTGTLSTGLKSPSGNCSDWSTVSASVSGRVGTTGPANNWTDNGTQTCDGNAHIYCFEQ